jgi:hypothetical protein
LDYIIIQIGKTSGKTTEERRGSPEYFQGLWGDRNTANFDGRGFAFPFSVIG